MLIALDNAVQFLFYPVLGCGVDWYGRRWGMIVAKSGVSLGFILSTLGLALIDDADVMWAVLAIAATAKGCTEIQHSALPSAVNDVIQDERRSSRRPSATSWRPRH